MGGCNEGGRTNVLLGSEALAFSCVRLSQIEKFREGRSRLRQRAFVSPFGSLSDAPHDFADSEVVIFELLYVLGKSVFFNRSVHVFEGRKVMS